jgi:hypothetical protein
MHFLRYVLGISSAVYYGDDNEEKPSPVLGVI